MRARRFYLVVPVVAAALAAQAACGTSTGLPIATVENIVDTVVLFALDGTPVYTPSAYDLSDRSTVRTDRATVGFDFAFNLTPAGQGELLSTGAMLLGKSSGFISKGEPFDAIAVAPGTGYQDSVPVPVDSGNVFIVRSRPSANCAGYGLSLPVYAKLEVLAIDTTARTVQFRILVDQNCGYHGLQPGLPSK